VMVNGFGRTLLVKVLGQWDATRGFIAIDG
jgi:hypothetical protein